MVREDLVIFSQGNSWGISSRKRVILGVELAIYRSPTKEALKWHYDLLEVIIDLVASVFAEDLNEMHEQLENQVAFLVEPRT